MSEESPIFISEVIERLVGPILPIGCSSEDARRLKNQNLYQSLVADMVDDIRIIAAEKDRHEASRSQAGKNADDFLKELSETLADSGYSNPELLEQGDKPSFSIDAPQRTKIGISEPERHIPHGLSPESGNE